MSAAFIKAGAGERLPADGRRVHQKSGASQTARGEALERATQG